MATLDLDPSDAAYQVRGYQPGMIQVNEQTYHESIIITPQSLIVPWSPRQLSELNKDALSVILELKPAIFLLGTGSVLNFPPIELYVDLLNMGIGVEIMDTSAAARTFNALAAENRDVVAALMIV